MTTVSFYTYLTRRTRNGCFLRLLLWYLNTTAHDDVFIRPIHGAEMIIIIVPLQKRLHYRTARWHAPSTVTRSDENKSHIFPAKRLHSRSRNSQTALTPEAFRTLYRHTYSRRIPYTFRVEISFFFFFVKQRRSNKRKHLQIFKFIYFFFHGISFGKRIDTLNAKDVYTLFTSEETVSYRRVKLRSAQ